MRRALLILAGAMALGACHRSPDAAVTGAPEAQLPKRRAGLWQETVMRDGKPISMGRTRICADPRKDSKTSVFGRKLGHEICPNHAIVRDPDGAYSFTSTCDMGPAGKITARGRASGDFSATSTSTRKATSAAPPLAPSTATTSRKWRSPTSARVRRA